MANSCKECGYPLNGNEMVCPECGATIDSYSTPNYTSTFESINESVDVDEWDYSQYQGGLFSQWYFECDEEVHEESYNTLNDILLLLNLGFRILWWIFWPPFLIFIAFALFALLVSPGPGAGVMSVLGIIISVIVAFCYSIPNAIKKFIVPLHRTWRRINKRYWISMAKAVKSNNPNIL